MSNKTTHKTEDADKIKALNTKYSEEVAEYKRFADARRANRKWTQERAMGVYSAIAEYIKERTTVAKKPITLAGVLLACGIPTSTWATMRKGDHDYLLEEYLAIHGEDGIFDTEDGLPVHRRTDVPEDASAQDSAVVLLLPWSEIVEKCELLIQQQLEENCYTNRGNPAGSIFGLKAKFEWREDTPPTHVAQTLVIADAERARELLELSRNR